MNTSPSQTQIIANAILDLLAEKGGDCEPAEVIEDLAKRNFDPWDVRQVIWDLTARAAAELTWDRKLRLGKHSGREIAA